MRTIIVGDKRVGLLGDPHLGRKFTTDVPLHRRGDHEAAVNAAFVMHMETVSGVEFHVCVGDLFDKPIVTPDIVLLAADAYRRASSSSPGATFVVLAGNHDRSRDVEVGSSFDLFEAIVDPLPNVIVVKNEPISASGLLFVPYNFHGTSHEMVADFTSHSYDAVFGHWDLISPRSEANTVPLIETQLYVCGHDHRAREVEAHGIPLICTGSMQGYAHGEGHPYVTVTLAELALLGNTRDLCLRLKLADGEEVPEGVDALQVGVLRDKRAEEEMDMNVEFSGFDMSAIFTQTLAKHGVGEGLIATLFEKYRSRG